MWRRYILLDFSAAREAALTWKAAFTSNSDMPTKDPDLFMRAIYYAGMFNYLLEDARNLNRQLRDLVAFVGDNSGGLQREQPADRLCVRDGHAV